MSINLSIINYVCSVSFTSVARADGHRKATYNLLLRSSKEIKTWSVLSFVPRTLSNSQCPNSSRVSILGLRSSMDLPSSRLCFLEIDFRWERRTTNGKSIAFIPNTPL